MKILAQPDNFITNPIKGDSNPNDKYVLSERAQ